MNHVIRIKDEDLETLLLEILYMQQGEGEHVIRQNWGNSQKKRWSLWSEWVLTKTCFNDIMDMDVV